jgi:hypothetical protein
MTDNPYPTDVEGWTRRLIESAGDVAIGGTVSDRREACTFFSSRRMLEPVHPHCPNCFSALEQPKLDLPAHQHRGVAFTVTCPCGTTATGVFYR